MPTAMRRGRIGSVGAEAWAGAEVGSGRSAAVGCIMGSLQKKREEAGRSRAGPPEESGREEACDKRSAPQDVTSSWPDAEGSICSKRSNLSRRKDLLATPPEDSRS